MKDSPHLLHGQWITHRRLPGTGLSGAVAAQESSGHIEVIRAIMLDHSVTDHSVTDHSVTDHSVTDHSVTDHTALTFGLTRGGTAPPACSSRTPPPRPPERTAGRRPPPPPPWLSRCGGAARRSAAGSSHPRRLPPPLRRRPCPPPPGCCAAARREERAQFQRRKGSGGTQAKGGALRRARKGRALPSRTKTGVRGGALTWCRGENTAGTQTRARPRFSFGTGSLASVCSRAVDATCGGTEISPAMLEEVSPRV